MKKKNQNKKLINKNKNIIMKKKIFNKNMKNKLNN